MKNSVKNHFVYNFWKYVAVVAIAIVFWCYLFGVLARPQPNEQIKITFVGNDLKNTLLKDDIQANLPMLTDNQNIKDVGVECFYSEDMYTLSTVLSTRVISDTDFVIIKESDLSKFDIPSFFVELDETLSKQYFGDVETYLLDGKIYGIKLSSETFAKYHSGENCYAFITGVSVNFGRLNGKGDVDDKVCVALINYLAGRA